MESKWPPPPPGRKHIGYITWCLVTAAMALGNLFWLTGPWIPIAVTAAAFCLAGAGVEYTVYLRRRWESERSRNLQREGATALGRSDAFLTLTPDHSNLSCNLTGGFYVRQPLADVAGIRLVPSLRSDDPWTLRLDRIGGDPLSIEFASPRDAESWYWRLLHARPDLGLEAARLRARDLYLPESQDVDPDLFQEWGRLAGKRRTSDSPLAVQVTPEFSEALIEFLTRRGLSPESRPTGLALGAPLLVVEPIPLPASPEMDFTPANPDTWLAPAMRVGVGLIFVVSLAAPVIRFSPGSSVMAIQFFSMAGLGGALHYYRRTRALRKHGVNYVHLMELGAHEALNGTTFAMVLPEQDHAFISTSDGTTTTFLVALIRRVRVQERDEMWGLEIQEKKEEFFPIGTPQATESLFVQLYAGLMENGRYQGDPPPPICTVVLNRIPGVGGRMSLRDKWLDASSLPLGRDIPTGPLVGPVTKSYANGLVEMLRAHGAEAEIIPFVVTDPKPRFPAPGHPAILKLVRAQATRPALPDLTPPSTPDQDST